MAYLGTIGSLVFVLGSFLERCLNYATVDSIPKQILEDVKLAMKRSHTVVQDDDSEYVKPNIRSLPELA